MQQAFIGSEAVRLGRLTRGQLRWNYTAVHPDVYIPNGAERTLFLNAVAAWLWTGRKGVIAGRAAAALHGAKWIDASTPIEMLANHGRRRKGLIVRDERLGADEIIRVGNLPVTTAARTALDLARHQLRDTAVAHLDALAAATGFSAGEALALADRYRGARGVRRARRTLGLMDGGAQSPKETWLRLLLIDAGLPRPRTQIRVSDGFNEAFIDVGYEEPMIGLDYDGSHHSVDRRQYVHDIGRSELLERQGWIAIRVVAEHSRRFVVHRLREAAARRGWSPPKSTPRS